MELDIVRKQNDITYEVPAVSFPAYEEYKAKARTVADYIGSMEVNEGSIKETKETLAKAKKLTDRLSRIRIDMKNELLQNYVIFEAQVKEIVSIIDDADKELRSKVKELDDMERNAKRDQIYEIWKKRTITCPVLTNIIPDAFDRWISPKHLNKSESMSNVEKDMTEWIRKTMGDIALAGSMGDEYLAMYSQCCDLARTIETVNRQKEAIKTVKREKDTGTEKETFTVYGTKDIALTERLLKENDIEYMKG